MDTSEQRSNWILLYFCLKYWNLEDFKCSNANWPFFYRTISDTHAHERACAMWAHVIGLFKIDIIPSNSVAIDWLRYQIDIMQLNARNLYIHQALCECIWCYHVSNYILQSFSIEFNWNLERFKRMPSLNETHNTFCTTHFFAWGIFFFRLHAHTYQRNVCHT